MSKNLKFNFECNIPKNSLLIIIVETQKDLLSCQSWFFHKILGVCCQAGWLSSSVAIFLGFLKILGQVRTINYIKNYCVVLFIGLFHFFGLFHGAPSQVSTQGLISNSDFGFKLHADGLGCVYSMFSLTWHPSLLFFLLIWAFMSRRVVLL